MYVESMPNSMIDGNGSTVMMNCCNWALCVPRHVVQLAAHCKIDVALLLLLTHQGTNNAVQEGRQAKDDEAAS